MDDVEPAAAAAEGAASRSDADLPRAARSRWQPLRSGLVNLFKYRDEEFRFEDGRLLLRGNNGAGKSRVLALQLPFLLDGELNPQRVEPDRDPAKRMEWNLLMNRHDDRLGYTWIEFGRLDEEGREHYLTLGCGLHARKGIGIPPQSRWFFITPLRIGSDLHLLNEKDVPLTRSRLEAELEGRGELYRSAREYRQAIDAALFQLGPRYRALVELLIRLRQPQLLRELDVSWLSGILSEALPPLSQALIDDVAAAFRGIEDDRQNMEEFRLARETVGEFRKTYRHYAQLTVRRSAAAVRRTHSIYEEKGREIKVLEATGERLQEILDRTENDLAASATDLQRSLTTEQTLRESPEMKSAAELARALEVRDERRTDSENARASLERAEERRASAREDQDRADAALEQSRRDADEQIARVQAIAEEAEIPDRLLDKEHESTEALESDRKAIEAVLAKRSAGLQRVEALNSELANAIQARKLATLERDRSQQDLQAVEEDEAIAAENQASELKRLLSSLHSWERSLQELPFESRDDWQDLLEDWLDQREGPNPLEAAIAKTGRDAQTALLSERERLAGARTIQEAQLLDLDTALRELGEGRPPEPTVPHTRSSDARRDIEGAPFWRLCGFADEVPSEQRAGFEAALESAGLLDAWIHPDGRVRDDKSHDVLLAAMEDGPAGQGGLNSVLRVEGDGVRAEVVRRVLAQIGTEPGAGDTWVSADGRWQNGPAHGSWQKPAAEYLGASAREASRLRKMAVLEAEREKVADRIEQLAEAENKLSARLERLAEEIRLVPAKDSLVEAALILQQTRHLVQEKRERLADAEKVALRQQEAWEEARARRDRDAEDLGLSSWREPEAAAQLKELLGALRELLAGAWPRVRARLVAAEHLARATRHLEEATEGWQRCERALQVATLRADQAEARYEALYQSIGSAAEEIMRRLEEIRVRIKELQDATERLREEKTDANAKLSVNRREQELAAEALQERAEHRAAAVAELNSLVAHRIFEEADPELQPEERDLKPYPAVDLARRTEQRLQGVALDEESLKRAQTRFQAEYTTLNDQLGMRGHHPGIEAIDGGAYKVTCAFQGQDRTMHELHDLLRDEVANRERMLDAEERKVIENHLIGEVATELQKSIREGDTWRSEVNEELERRPTSSGIKLRFAWNVDPDGPAGLAQARQQLLRTTTAWSPEERNAIGDFLHDRIRSQQAQNEGGSWQEHLTAALDYRAWHRFEVERYQDGQWKKLTKRTYGTSSGGEKALTLTVPQFAAAAAHYQSASPLAPRLILLDEVFVGIDGPTRAKLMGLLHSFDLDFVMTSEREWGCYPTMPKLAIYQLASRPDIPAVHVTRWVWNGRERLKGDP